MSVIIQQQAQESITGSTYPRMTNTIGTANKFWEITVNGSETYVTYGKVGTKGMSQLKEHDTEDNAKAFAAKQVATKTKGGYIDASQTQPLMVALAVETNNEPTQQEKEKEAAKQAKAVEKEAAKQAKAVEKEAAKQAKAVEKEAAKQAKAMEKEAAKQAKAMEKEAAKQEKVKARAEKEKIWDTMREWNVVRGYIAAE